jgi:hypothetical protein
MRRITGDCLARVVVEQIRQVVNPVFNAKLLMRPRKEFSCGGRMSESARWTEPPNHKEHDEHKGKVETWIVRREPSKTLLLAWSLRAA